MPIAIDRVDTKGSYNCNKAINQLGLWFVSPRAGVRRQKSIPEIQAGEPLL
jgi:hypothetical protein